MVTEPVDYSTAAADAPLQIAASRDAGVLTLTVVGEIDIRGYRQWTHVLRKIAFEPGNAHLQLSRLRFIDVRGISALVSTAHRLDSRRRLILHDPPHILIQLLEVGWRCTHLEVRQP